MRAMSFSSGIAPAKEASDKDDYGAGFDEEFAAVEPVDGGAF